MMLQTATSPRPLAPTYIRRPRLLRLISRGIKRGLVLVAAPGGYGKTSLAAEWYGDGSGGDRCWVTLSEEINTPEQMVTQLVRAIRTCRSDALAATHLEVEAGSTFRSEDALIRFVNELCDLKPLTLIVDDLHTISDREALEALAFILDHLPPAVSAIICCRHDPPLPLTRWRSSGRLADIRAADLRFSEDEARLLLDLLAAGDLDEEQIGAAVKAADGWPTGVYLAGVAGTGTSLPRIVDGLGAGITAIADFFVTEVLDDLPEEWRMTLIETSILDTLTLSLAERVTARPDASETVRALSRMGLFVAESPSTVGSFRVHAMLRPLLRLLLSEEYSADQIADLHLRATVGLQLEGDYLGAVEHASMANDIELADELIRSYWREMLRTDPEGLTSLLRQMEDPARPLSDLELYLAVVRPDRSRLDVDSLRRASSEGGCSSLTAIVRHLRGDTAIASDPSSDLGALPEGWAEIYRGIALTVCERYQEAESRLTAAASADRNDAILMTAATAGLAWSHARAGRLGASRTLAIQALDRAAREGHRWFYATAWARLALAHVAYDQGRLDEAHRIVSAASAQPVLDDSVRVELAILFSRVLSALGDGGTARTVLNNAFTGGDGLPITGILGLRLVLAHAALCLSERDPQVATAWLPDWEHRLAIGPWLPSERMILARLLIEHDRPDEARALLADPEGEADRSHRSVLESWKLAAIAAERAGDPSGPLALEIAVSMAQSEGFVQLFSEDSNTLAKVARLTTSGVTIPVGSASIAFAKQRTAAEAPDTRTIMTGVLVEELTDRELAVLRFMPTRLSNREIAEELFVSINTVKSHIKNVYRKLGVTTRREAVSRAVSLRVL